ncbi:sensor histidine kinase [Roseateles koreensis]|uniref:histidine kinase n=1 Tax=Roseateles koreensis TaxID=2987526 RepID=A0ABT5KP58_9BURK|nr:PAS domain S-box protein [Roseateles koreensis]MDC8784710.1 PAS domain S-box protein [Roseateles koreensis]
MSAPMLHGRPTQVAPPHPTSWRRALWSLPLVLSLVFVAGVLIWVRNNEIDERETQRLTLISDALSTEAQLRAKLREERTHLRELADAMQGQPPTAESLARHPEMNAGLRRLWLSVIWLDRHNRVLTQLPAPTEGPRPRQRDIADQGLSLHLSEPVGPGGRDGTLVLRYSPALLLQRGVPWWLARKYDVQMVDSADEVIASITEGPMRAAQGERPSYRVGFVGPFRTSPLNSGPEAPAAEEAPLSDAALELTLREPQITGLRPLALILIAGFLPLVACASWLLRRQVRQVSRAETAWRAEAAWRRAMEDSALVGLRARDANGALLYVNRTFCDMVGLPAERLVGLSPPMPYWPPDAIEEVMQRNRRNLAGHAPREGYEARWRHQDGHILDVMVFESPLVDAAGQQIGWMGSIIDVTARKRLEERERRQIDTLAHHARLTMLGEVASTLAHELNQPLTAIASYNAGVINSLARLGVQDPVVMGALQRLGAQAAQAGRVVQRIRHFLTRREPQHEACELNRVIRDAVELLQRELQRGGVALTLELGQDLPPLLADAVLVEQVVINLLRNACDALQARSADRHIVLRSRHIQTTALAPSVSSAEAAIGKPELEFLRVDVSDNGPGLDGRTAEALCAPFFSTKAEGMGMGLAICRSIIEAHHGVLDACEAVDGGAAFSFSLPLRPLDSLNAEAGEALDFGDPPPLDTHHRTPS